MTTTGPLAPRSRNENPSHRNDVTHPLETRSITVNAMLFEQLAQERHHEACTQARQARLARLFRADRRASRAADAARTTVRRLVPAPR